ncbi:MAG: SGNH/GDSL hydrolase family protein [Chthoniobacter sp.]|nr:SGNH/GDSL hydrolase family protein [Chthoniobacter sp.]
MKFNYLHLRFALVVTLLSVTPCLFAQTAAPQKGGQRKEDPSLAGVEDVAGLPRVLLIGDSISMGYTIPTRAALAGVANIHRIPANGGSTDVGLKNIDVWLATGGADRKWDVIHFNWGLHDLKHWKDGKLDLTGPQVNPLEQYEKNLREIVARLKKTGAKLVFATTTPVPGGSGGRVEKDELAYNESALRIMKAEGVAIDDLHAIVRAKPDTQLPANVHFTADGYKVLAAQVVSSIKDVLKK